MVAIEKQTSRQNYELQNKYRRQIKGTANLCLFCKNNVISSVLLVFFFSPTRICQAVPNFKADRFLCGLANTNRGACFFLTNLEFSSASEQRTTNFVNIMSQGAEEPNFNLCRNSIYIVALVSGSLSSLRLVLCYPIYLFMRRLKPSGYRLMFITRTQRVTLFVARRVTKGKRSFPNEAEVPSRNDHVAPTVSRFAGNTISC